MLQANQVRPTELGREGNRRAAGLGYRLTSTTSQRHQLLRRESADVAPVPDSQRILFECKGERSQDARRSAYTQTLSVFSWSIEDCTIRQKLLSANMHSMTVLNIYFNEKYESD